MPSSPLTRTYTLEDGLAVHLRLARRADLEPVRSLLGRRGVESHDLEILRLLSFDPLTRAVVCVFAPIDGQETLVGVGAIALERGALPDTLVTDEQLAPGLAPLLGALLAERAEAHGRRVA